MRGSEADRARVRGGRLQSFFCLLDTVGTLSIRKCFFFCPSHKHRTASPFYLPLSRTRPSRCCGLERHAWLAACRFKCGAAARIMGNCLAPAAQADGGDAAAQTSFPEPLGAPPGFQQSTHRAIKLLGRGESSSFFDRSVNAHLLSSPCPAQRLSHDSTLPTLLSMQTGAYADTWLFRDVKRSRLVAIKLFKRPLARDSLPIILREAGLQAELGPSSIHLIEGAIF